ncbi:MAG: DUF5659 domain-containing protein [Thermodesulfobacteriota bacterium]|jgi:hypothetical protein
MDTQDRVIYHIILVAYLQAAGIKQSSFPTVVNHRVAFHFKDTPELEEYIEKFYLRQTSVDALTLMDAYRNLTSWAGELKSSGKAEIKKVVIGNGTN